MEPGKGGPAGNPGKPEAGKRDPPHGVLAQLEALEARDRRAAVEQEEREQQEERAALLESRARELRLRRDELREKLERLEKGGLGKAGMPSDPAHPDPRAVLEWRIRSLKALLQVFHLTGISGKLSKHQSLSFPIPRDLWEALPAPIPVHPHSQGSLGSSPSTNPCPSPFPGISGKLSKRGLCLTLSTSYEGSHLDSFHLELLLRPEVRIQRHSIPAFIPLEQLSRRFLATDLRRFLALLSQHLEGYSGRRFQADQLQERFSDWIQGAPQRNSLCNLLKFSYSPSRNSRTFPLRARLLYRDPLRSLPTEVTVSCSPDAPAALAATASEHSELFRRVALHRAFQTFAGTHGNP
ncbi:centromere protein O isoform X4 [Manacus candei]|uniref:centromere protein O isoform X4 n=1 Tax=Manacus candei TaxID=415023 RepID=UPI0022277DBC|nr:centromere protein O isoform X4 [Manacus candei]